MPVCLCVRVCVRTHDCVRAWVHAWVHKGVKACQKALILSSRLKVQPSLCACAHKQEYKA